MPRALVNIGYDGRVVEASEDLDALNLPKEVEQQLVDRGEAEADSKSKSGSSKKS